MSSSSTLDQLEDTIMELPETPGTPGSPSATHRMTGRRKFLSNFKRIGSSQSLLNLSRSRSSSYRGLGPASVSCFSLSSNGQTFGSSYDSHFSSNGFSTAPTTPGVDSPFSDGTSHIRTVGLNGVLLCGPSTAPLPGDFATHGLQAARPNTSMGTTGAEEEDYFSMKLVKRSAVKTPSKPAFDFWARMPAEIKMQIFRLLSPKEIVRCARVSKSWHSTCFDGQLWATLDASEFYRDIPAEALIKIITGAGPFAKDLNLRGCVQLWDSWRRANLSEACRNLQNISLQGCSIDRNSIHGLLYHNPRLVHIDLTGLVGVTNSTMSIIAQQCPKLEFLNVSWCQYVDGRGLRKVINGCPQLRDLRASEVRGFNDIDLMVDLFNSNNLERLVVMNCEDMMDEALVALMTGVDAPVDYITGRKIVPPRKLKHLDLTRCRNLTDYGLRSLVGHLPELEGLQLSKCDGITEASLKDLFPTLTKLTHLDLEELSATTNAALQKLACSPCAPHLKHLNVSYCENVGDTGMLPVLRLCAALRNVEMDNTKVSNLCLLEIVDLVRKRSSPRSSSWDAACAAATVSESFGPLKPRVALRVAVYDCANVSWAGIREVMASNSDVQRPRMPHSQVSGPASTRATPMDQSRNSSGKIQPYEALPVMPQVPHQIIAIKVFYGYQPTVTEHTRRCLSGNFVSAQRLERKWAEYMMASEEAGAPGGFIGGVFAGFVGAAGNGPWGLPGHANRRRRRRAREAAMMHADEEDADDLGGMSNGVGRRRRARSGGVAGGPCTIM